jgi:hypothetical protein
VTEIEYFGFYRDVYDAFNAGDRNGHPFLHHRRFGYAEGRCPVLQPCALPVSPSEYMELYDPAYSSGYDAYTHYDVIGRYNGHCPLF